MARTDNESIIGGVHSVYEALTSVDRPIERLHIARGTVPEKVRRVVEMAEARGIPVRRETREALDRLAPNLRHQGIVAIGSTRTYQSFELLLRSPKPLLVVLDRVQDPHNLGAVIRTAETAGATGLVVTERRSASLSAAVSRSSAGALEHLPVARVSNLVSALKSMKSKGIWIVGVDAKAPICWTDFDYTVPVALVLGGEHKGIRRLVRESCDAVVRLPMYGKIQSLNVSVAAGVVLYEAARQRAILSSSKPGSQKGSEGRG